MRMRMLGSTPLNVIGIPEQAQGEHWSGYPPTGHAEAARRLRSTVAQHGSRTATAGHTGTHDEETRIRHLQDPHGSGTLPRCLGRRPGRWPHLSDSLRAGWGPS